MISFRIYWNRGSGPVDFSAPVGTTSALTFTLPPVPGGGTLEAVVRPYDTVTGLENVSNQARAVVVLGPDAANLSGAPGPPFGLTVTPRPAGTARVAWHQGPGSTAAGFHVYAWPAAGPPSYAVPVGEVSAIPGGSGLPRSFRLTGLTPGVTYAVAVRAFNAAAEEQNPVVVPVTPAAAGPAPVVGLTATTV